MGFISLVNEIQFMLISSRHISNGSIVYYFQKLISDDRFRSSGEEEDEDQLPVQFISAVVSTPSLSDEVQVEIMKVTDISATFNRRAQLQPVLFFADNHSPDETENSWV